MFVVRVGDDKFCLLKWKRGLQFFFFGFVSGVEMSRGSC